VSELHDEVLDASTRRVFKNLGGQPELAGFYLAGGTGAALHLGHRRSDDLDLFSERPWAWERVGTALSAAGAVDVDRLEPGTFVGAVNGVRVSLFHYPNVLLEEPATTSSGLPVAGLVDIGCMKLVAVAQRGSRKDFIDLYYLGREGITIRELLRLLARKMPGIEHNPVHVLRSLAFFEDAEDEPDPVMLVPYRWADVRRYCLEQADALLEEIAGQA